jgi:hypothetical protein
MAWTERYCSVAGGGAHDGTTAADAWTLAEAIAGAAAGHRVNVIVGTYANTTTARTFATAGTTTAPVWWRGYKTAIGDMDGQPTTTRVAGTDIPEITFTTGACTFSGAHQFFSNIHFASARTAGAAFTISTGAGQKFVRNRFINTGNNASATAVSNAVAAIIESCYFEAHANATNVVAFSGAGTTVRGCVVSGGINNFSALVSTSIVIGCLFKGASATGINQSAGGAFVVDRCTFYNIPDGIKWTTSAPVTGTQVTNSIFDSCSTTGLNNATGTNSNLVFRAGNLFHGNGANEAGFGDAPSFFEQADAGSPFTAAGSDDFSLVTGSNAKANGVPGLFENLSVKSYLDIGAVQREEAATGGMLRHPGMSGGLNG